MADHDSGYKLLFSHAPVVADLLTGFVHEPWVADLDLSTLERVNASYVTASAGDLRSRESDVVWRVRWHGGDEWIYIYILLELQSTNDPTMALRILAYVALLYQDLQRDGVKTASGHLPPIFPVVAYNGKPAWGSAQEMVELIAEVPGFMDRYRPHLSYFLLDVGRIGEDDLAGQNMVAALVRLERSRQLEDVRNVVEALLVWLSGPKHAELRRAFAAWIREVVLPVRLPGVAVPEVADLLEVRSMLAERVVEWTQEWKQEGFEEGLVQGREEALEALRTTVRRLLEQRFGPLPVQAQERLQGLHSVSELAALIAGIAQAPSLASLGL